MRLQASIESTLQNVKGHTKRMADFEQKVEVVRAQMTRIGKFDGAVESFTR